VPHTEIYRAPMRARDLDLPPGAGAEFGLAHGVVAIGDVPERARRRFAELPDGALVWTRDANLRYRVGRIGGPCRVDDSAAAREVGMRHVRPADWLDLAFTAREAPDAVVKTFGRGGRNFQRTHDEAAERETARLWERASKGD
jgi:hypothetical protein